MSIPPATTTATATAAAAAASTFGLLLPTPSSLDGVPAHVEARLRAYGCGLIVRACAAMTQSEKRGDDDGDKDTKQGEAAAAAAAAPPPIAVPAAAAATAQALLHRFYARHSLARPATGDVRRVAAAMTWLALKLEEGYGDAHRVTRRLLLVFARLEARDAAAADAAAAEAAKKKDASPASPPPPSLPLLLAYSRPYEQRRASLSRIERLALDASGFSCAVEHPHKLLLGLSHVLSSPPPSTSSPSSPSLAEEAWALANDSLRTPLCMRFGPEVVAAGCLFLASRRLGVALPEGGEGEEEGEDDDGGGKGGGEGGNDDDGGGEKNPISSPASPPPPSGPWWRLLGVSTADVFEVARVVAALLEAEPPGYEDASAWLREKREREGGAGGGGERAATATATAAATTAAVAAAGLRPPSALGSAAASAVAKARAAAARAAAARKKPRR